MAVVQIDGTEARRRRPPPLLHASGGHARRRSGCLRPAAWTTTYHWRGARRRPADKSDSGSAGRRFHATSPRDAPYHRPGRGRQGHVQLADLAYRSVEQQRWMSVPDHKDSEVRMDVDRRSRWRSVSQAVYTRVKRRRRRFTFPAARDTIGTGADHRPLRHRHASAPARRACSTAAAPCKLRLVLGRRRCGTARHLDLSPGKNSPSGRFAARIRIAKRRHRLKSPLTL